MAWKRGLSIRVLAARTFAPGLSSDNDQALVRRGLARYGQGTQEGSQDGGRGGFRQR